MSKKDFIRTPDSNQRIVDVNLAITGAFKIPVFSGNPGIGDNPNEAGYIGYKSGKITYYDGTQWITINSVPSGGNSGQYLRGDNTWQTLNTDAVVEGSNFYYTEARFTASLTGKSTTDISEGTNLYYTQARFNNAFGAKSTTDLAEGTNLYYTNARVQSYSDGRYLQLSGGTLLGDVQQTVNPVNANSLITKSYVDALITGLTWKSEVRAATTGNISLSGTQTVDGVALVAGNRVLVKNQTNQSQNGIYIVASGAWTRATDADTTDEIEGATVMVRLGTQNRDTQWTNTNINEPVVGTDAITFAQIAGSGTYTNGTGLNLNGNVFSLDLTYADARYIAAADAKYVALTGSVSTGMQTIQLNTEQLRLAYGTDPSKYTSFVVNSAGSINISSIGSFSITAAGANATAFNNNGAESGRFDVNGNFGVGTGATVSAKVHAISTGEQLRIGYNAANYSSINTTASGQTNFTSSLGSAGIYNFTGTVNISGGITQTGVNYNITIPAAFTPASVGAVYSMGGSSIQYIRTGFYGNSGISMVSGSSYSNVVVASSPITTAATGTHPVIASAYFKAPSVTATAGSTITNLSTVYIEAAPTAATASNTYALYVGGQTQVAKNSNDTIAAFTINQQQGGGNIINLQFGTNNVAFINTSGRFSAEGLGNITTGANALIQPTTTGTVITRSQTVAGVSLTVNQVQGTSAIQVWTGLGVTVATMGIDGGLVLSGSIKSAGTVKILNASGYTTAQTITVNMEYLRFDCSGGAVNQPLPTAVGKQGQVYTLKKVDSSTNALTVSTTSSQTIDNASTWVLATQNKYLTVISNNVNWEVIGNN